MISFRSFLFALVLVGLAQAQNSPYPNMAPADQYLMERSAEIALARSAAPEAVSRDATVMVLGKRGYETAAKGKNDFVCLVERSWSAPQADPGFWNPKTRGPICLNAPAVRTYLPLTLKKSELALSGRSKAQIAEAIKAALDKKEIPSIETGAMSYMLSKQQYLGDAGVHWHPHLMFFVPLADAAAWGADVPGSPIISGKVPEDRLTIFMVPVEKWSDGTADHGPSH